MENKLQKEIQDSVTPFLLRIVAIITLIGGILGVLFFFSVIFFKIDGSNFPNYFKYKDAEGIVFTIFLVLQILIHLGFILCAIQLIRNKKIGVYIFIACFMLFIFSRLYYNSSSLYVEIFSGLVLLLFMMISWRKLK